MKIPAKIVAWIDRVQDFWQMYGQHSSLIFDAIISMPCAVTLLRGPMRGDGKAISVLYVGRRRNYPYLLRTIFDSVEVVDEVHSTLLTYSKKMRRMTPEADVTIVDIGWPYHGRVNRRSEYLVLPDWVNMSLTLAADWDEVVKSFRHTTRNNDLRLIRRNKYFCEPSNDLSVIEDFYDNMYLPFIQHRHQQDSVEASRQHLVDRASNGTVLQIFKGQELVAAGVVYPEDGVLYFLWMGLPAKYLEKPPEAAISALYFFGIKYAFDNGYGIVDFTGNRPFLTDGAFRFKRKWGAMLEDTFSPSSILIKPHSNNKNAALFCQRFPMLARRGEDLEALFLYYNQEVDDAELKKIDGLFGCEGIDQVAVLDVSDTRTKEPVSIGGIHDKKRVVRCGLDAFSDHYARYAINNERGR